MACFFRYHERWTEILPELVDSILVAVETGDRTKLDETVSELARILDDRDSQLEEFIELRVCCDCEPPT